MYYVLQDVDFWNSWRSISLGAELWQEYFNPKVPNQLSPMFYINGNRQIVKRLVLFSSTMLFEQSSSSDIDTLLRRNIQSTLMFNILWTNLFDTKDQLMNVRGSGEDELFWKTNKELRIIPLR